MLISSILFVVEVKYYNDRDRPAFLLWVKLRSLCRRRRWLRKSFPSCVSNVFRGARHGVGRVRALLQLRCITDLNIDAHNKRSVRVRWWIFYLPRSKFRVYFSRIPPHHEQYF